MLLLLLKQGCMISVRFLVVWFWVTLFLICWWIEFYSLHPRYCCWPRVHDIEPSYSWWSSESQSKCTCWTIQQRHILDACADIFCLINFLCNFVLGWAIFSSTWLPSPNGPHIRECCTPVRHNTTGTRSSCCKLPYSPFMVHFCAYETPSCCRAGCFLLLFFLLLMHRLSLTERLLQQQLLVNSRKKLCLFILR